MGFPIAVLYKFFDDHGTYLAAIITYYAFVSLFPLLFLLTAILGFVLRGNEHLQQQILHSTLSRFPVIGSQLGDPKGLTGNTAGITFSIIVSIYGALGVAQAAQHAMNVAWARAAQRAPEPAEGARTQPPADRDGRARHPGDDRALGAVEQR